MADLSQMLSQILSTDEGKNQVSQVLSMLGQGDHQAGSSPATQNSMPDLSGLLASLQGAVAQPQQSNQSNQSSNGGGNGMPDLSGLLASLQGAGSQPQQNSSGSSGGVPDLSGLLSMLGGNSGGGGGNGGGGGLPNLDIGKLMKVQQLLSQRRDDSSSALLRALKPHLMEENRKKVDDAVRIMELLDLLPLIKESGLLGSLLGGEQT